MASGCVGSQAASRLLEADISCRMRLLNLGNRFIQHGSVAQLRDLSEIDARAIATTVKEALRHEK